MCDWEGCTTATNELPNPNQRRVVKTSGFLHPYIYRYTARVPRDRFLAFEGEGITWMRQPSRQGIALFLVRMEFLARHNAEKTRILPAAGMRPGIEPSVSRVYKQIHPAVGHALFSQRTGQTVTCSTSCFLSTSGPVPSAPLALLRDLCSCF